MHALHIQKISKLLTPSGVREEKRHGSFLAWVTPIDERGCEFLKNHPGPLWNPSPFWLYYLSASLLFQICQNGYLINTFLFILVLLRKKAQRIEERKMSKDIIYCQNSFWNCISSLLSKKIFLLAPKLPWLLYFRAIGWQVIISHTTKHACNPWFLLLIRK